MVRREAEISVYAAVYEAVDTAVALERCSPAADASVQRALVHFRNSKADPDAIRQLEDISVHLHELAAADFRHRRGNRRETAEHLRRLGVEWMARLPMQ